MQKPTRVYRHAHTYTSTRKCGYTHEHLLMSCYRIKLMKFLRFQEVELQALVNAERSTNSCNNRRLHRRWATIVSALPITTLQVALGTPKILPNALLCPQSPPNRFLCSPLCPSSKATAWVFAFADHFYRPSARTSINL